MKMAFEDFAASIKAAREASDMAILAAHGIDGIEYQDPNTEYWTENPRFKTYFRGTRVVAISKGAFDYDVEDGEALVKSVSGADWVVVNSKGTKVLYSMIHPEDIADLPNFSKEVKSDKKSVEFKHSI